MTAFSGKTVSSLYPAISLFSFVYSASPPISSDIAELSPASSDAEEDNSPSVLTGSTCIPGSSTTVSRSIVSAGRIIIYVVRNTTIAINTLVILRHGLGDSSFFHFIFLFPEPLFMGITPFGCLIYAMSQKLFKVYFKRADFCQFCPYIIANFRKRINKSTVFVYFRQKKFVYKHILPIFCVFYHQTGL